MRRHPIAIVLIAIVAAIGTWNATNPIASQQPSAGVEPLSVTATVGARFFTAEPSFRTRLPSVIETTTLPTHTIQPVGLVRELFGGILVEDRAGANGLAVANVWKARRGESMFEVLAGTYNADVRPSETPSDSRYHLPDGPDIPYGAIRVVEYDTHWKPLANDDYITPVPAGSLAIVDIVDDKFHLRTGLGEDLIFDLKTRQYVAMKQPSGESREITDGLVESRPQNAITIDGYLAYAQRQLDDMEPPLRITAYTSERPYKGSRLVVETESLREPVTLSVREGHTMALRAVRIIENNYLLLLEGRTTAVVLDLHQKRLLSSLDAYSVMVAAGRPFSWP